MLLNKRLETYVVPESDLNGLRPFSKAEFHVEYQTPHNMNLHTSRLVVFLEDLDKKPSVILLHALSGPTKSRENKNGRLLSGTGVGTLWPV